MGSDRYLNSAPGSPESASFWRNGRSMLALAGILLGSFLVYLPSLGNGFVNWDDQANIYNNPQITRIHDIESFFTSLQDIFSTHLFGNYNPLTLASFALEKLLFGLENPSWFHLNNILLHLLCVLLVFRIALALGLKLFPACFFALLFGIQPMRVESVAWVTERKDVLYGLFYLLALYYYIKAVKEGFQKRYSGIILGSFVLALLAKIQAVALPLSMLLVDYYFKRTVNLRLILEKWLYFSLSLVTGLLGIYLLRVDGGIQNNNLFSLFERLFIGSYAYVIYLIKSLVPYQMVPVYPYPAGLDWMFYASMVVTIGILGLIAYGLAKNWPEIVFGLLFFTVNIMFMLQILGAGQGFIADRFSYIAYFGLFFLYAYSLQWFLDACPRWEQGIYLAVAILCCVYGYVNFQQNKIWKNGETLWSHVLNHYPNSSLVWENRADYYREQGRTKEAIADFSQALVLKPNNPVAYTSRGNLYLQLNQPLPAIHDFDAAEQLAPADPDIYIQRAQAYFKLERYSAAQSDLKKYLRFRPDDPAMWSNLGTASRLNKQYPAALQSFNRAIELAPGTLDYYYKRSITYYEMGDIDRARKELAALREKGFSGINPAFNNLFEKTPELPK